jgi:hypothetical protein
VCMSRDVCVCLYVFYMYSHPPKSPVAVPGAGVSRMCSGRGSLHGKIQVKSGTAKLDYYVVLLLVANDPAGGLLSMQRQYEESIKSKSVGGGTRGAARFGVALVCDF